MFKRFLAYYKPHKTMFILDLLSAFFVSVIGMIYPIVTRKTLNDYVPNSNLKMVLIMGIVLLCIYLLRALLKYFIQYYGHIIGVRMQAQMRTDLFNKLQKLPYSFFDNNDTGIIMSTMTNDLFSISEVAHHGPENLIISVIMILLSFIYLITIQPLLTLIIYASIPFLFIIGRISRKKFILSFSESKRQVALINSSISSSISGIRVTKAFTNSKKEREKFEFHNENLVSARKQAFGAMAQYNATSGFVTDFFNVLVIIAGGIFLIKGIGNFNFADYSTFIISISLFTSPLTQLFSFMEQFEDAASGFKRFVQILEEPEEYQSPNAIELKNVKGNIEFKNVEFSYNDNKEVLHNINLKVNQGQTIALVGNSGGGKTTICHLIPRFYNITQGEILIDGINIKDVTLKSLRENIGIVQQDVFLFGGTIRENIMYGNPNATEEEMIECSKKANIHDYIMTMENGYDTEIGERGVKLSGGQKQRLSIARVFLKNPPILILDEATSALDNTTEILIQSALDELCKNRTTLIVAHRLSTIKNADEIIVISDGEIIEKGSHETLMNNQSMYKNLYSLQFRQK